MPELIVCPECDGKLKIPERLMGKKVKCPSCKAVFEAQPAAEEEEVEEVEERRVTGKPGRSRDRDRDEEEDDRPRRRRAADDDDEEDDRPRRRRREEDDDDYDDAPRKKRERDPREVLSWARLSALLVFIGSCCSLGAVGVLLLLHIMLYSSNPFGTMGKVIHWMTILLVAVPGLGGTITADVGLVFGLFGPRKKGAFGLSIAVVAVAGIHLLFLILAPLIAASRSTFGMSLFGMGAGWATWGTAFPALQSVVFADTFGFDVLAFLCALLELARLILYALWVRAMLANYKKSDSLAVGVIIVVGIMAVLLPLLGLIPRLAAGSGMGGGGARATVIIIGILTDGAIVAAWVFAFLLAMQVRDFLAYVKPKKE